jgi:glyceraldehyde 3-phosphate dehydrogenase
MKISPDSNDAIWSERQTYAEQLVPLVGSLFRSRGVAATIYGSTLVNKSAMEIIKAHRYARHVIGSELSTRESFELLSKLADLDLPPVNLDLALLLERVEASSTDAEILKALGLPENTNIQDKSVDVVLYGFGRIGRLLARLLIAGEGSSDRLALRAIVVRQGSDNDLVKRASLLRRDSVHGKFNGVISIDKEANQIIANGTRIQIIYANNPATIDYESYGIHEALVIDNTGIWRDEEGLSQHLKSSGVSRVLLTAPGKGDLKNIVFGINDSTISSEDLILTAASCTTNAITPVLKVVNDAFEVKYGHVETVHSYTNDQNLIDNFHKGDRRGRSAPMNLVIAETGAAKAVAKALPELQGKLTGNAIRVPTPNVSMAILNLELSRDVSKEEVNTLLRNASLFSALHDQIDFIDSPEVVSTDFVGSSRAGIVDGLATIARGNHVVLYIWYDNEFGYSNQVIRVAERFTGVQRIAIPAR